MNELPQLPLARTDAQNVFSEQNTFSQSIRLIRKDRKTFQPLIFGTEEDVAKNPNDYQALALDYSNDGGFLALFDGVLQADILQFGTSRPGCRGHIGICTAPLPGTQLAIRDLAGSGVNISVSVYSDKNGIHLNSASQHYDGITLERGDTPNSAWACWHQGSGVYDWRMGMVPGGYDFCVYGGYGEATSPSNPGDRWMEFHRDPGGMIEKDLIRVNTRFQCAEITDLQAKVQALTERIIALEG